MRYLPIKVPKKEKGPQKCSPTADQLQRGSLARGKNPQTDGCNTQGNKTPMRGKAKEVGNVQRQGDVAGK